jgi:hypothetical protein
MLGGCCLPAPLLACPPLHTQTRLPPHAAASQLSRQLGSALGAHEPVPCHMRAAAGKRQLTCCSTYHVCAAAAAHAAVGHDRTTTKCVAAAEVQTAPGRMSGKGQYHQPNK